KNADKEDMKEKEEGKLQVYEVGYHIVPAVPMESLQGEVENIKNFLAKEGAAITSEEFPKLIELAYSISKVISGAKRNFNTAYFGWIKFDAGEAPVAKIKKFFDENENILRFLLIKTVKESTLFTPKLFDTSTKEEAKSSKNDLSEKEIKSPISQEELDKTIDKLIAE
ncbi:MAG: 30S ribosomal protein S6, partial [Patescibacteria group bacterium]